MELSKFVNQLQDVAHQGYALFDVEVHIKHPDSDIDIILNPNEIKTAILSEGKIRLVISEED